MSANPDSVVGQGEFHDSVPKTNANANEGPQIHNKFKEGSEGAPEFTTQVLDTGSAPKDKVLHPNPTAEAAGRSYSESKKETWTSAQDTLTGSTSKDVYNTNTMGKPFQGEQTQSDAKFARHRGEGIEGYGSSPVGIPFGPFPIRGFLDAVRSNMRQAEADNSQTDPKEEKGATKDHENPKGGKLNDRESLQKEGLLGAEERDNLTGESAAREGQKGGNLN